ncbi:MAG: AAA family ATPase, partial [Nitrososphaera sp.]|nr:AAA family ATPase [Nitrososphaera sp.]
MIFKRMQDITGVLAPKRVLVVYGPRRVGKTTLVKEYLASLPSEKSVRYDVGDDIALRRLLGSEERKNILDYARPYDVIVIDEAQQIPNIGLAAKIMIDEFPDKTIILTGSSSFDLAQHVGEPLTGRHYTLTLFPIAQKEVPGNSFDKKQHMEDFLIYGSYPEVLSVDTHIEKERILKELVASYLFKDILALDRLRSPELLIDITRCLAFQVGNEVSFNEIARTV